MTRVQLIDLYFAWMSRVVSDRHVTHGWSYTKLLSLLNDIPFEVLLPMDENRSDAGISLRYEFAYEEGYDEASVASCLDDRPCSVLEMMIALAMACQGNADDSSKNTIGFWFYSMVSNLGLYSMDDSHFDENYVRAVIERFNNREYAPNGAGGLFIINNCEEDLRNVEIWYQMCWYQNEVRV